MKAEEKKSQIRIFLADTGEEIASGISDTPLHLSAEQPEQEEASYWSPGSYEITGTVNIDPKDAKRLRDMFIFSREERRKMSHAVTHGQAIVFVGNFNAEGHEPFQAPVVIDRPSVLRKAFAMSRGARFKYAIVPKDCCDKYVRLEDLNPEP